jgi:hypothetical protein
MMLSGRICSANQTQSRPESSDVDAGGEHLQGLSRVF